MCCVTLLGGKRVEIKNVAIRCQILKLIFTEFDFGWGSPLGRLTALSQTRSWI